MQLIEMLKNFPDKWLVLIVFVIIFSAYLHYQNDYLGQLVQTTVGVLFGMVGLRARQTVDASTESGDVQVAAPKQEV